MASTLPVVSPTSPKLPADPEKSPSEGNGQFLSHMMPPKLTPPTTRQQIQFGLSTIPQSKLLRPSNPQTSFGFASQPWMPEKEQDFATKAVVPPPSVESPVSQPPTAQQPISHPPRSPPSRDQTHSLQSATLQPEATQCPLGHAESIEFKPEHIQGELLQNQDFLAEIGKRLLLDKSFINNVICKIEQELQSDARFIPESLTQRYIAASKPLISLCTSNGLPEPHIHSTSTINEHGNVEFEVEIKLGMQGKSLFRSQNCKSLEEALAQANNEALQMLEDLGFTTTNGSKLIKDNRMDDRRGEAQHHSQSQILGSVKHPIIKDSQTQTRPSAERSQYTRSVRGPSPVLHCTPNRKRQVSKMTSDQQESAHVNIPSLMARLYNVAPADGEARISVICDYLNTNEPTLEKSGSGKEFIYLAHFKDARLCHIDAEGSSVAIVFRQLERKLLEYLEVTRTGRMAKSHTVNKRRRVYSSNNQDYITINDEDSDDDENDDPNGLFMIDPTGDEQLAISRASRF